MCTTNLVQLLTGYGLSLFTPALVHFVMRKYLIKNKKYFWVIGLVAAVILFASLLISNELSTVCFDVIVQ